MNELEQQNLLTEWLEMDVTRMKRRDVESQVQKHQLMLVEVLNKTTDPVVAGAYRAVKAWEAALALFGRTNG